jgi:hypothetical protein
MELGGTRYNGSQLIKAAPRWINPRAWRRLKASVRLSACAIVGLGHDVASFDVVDEASA